MTTEHWPPLGNRVRSWRPAPRWKYTLYLPLADRTLFWRDGTRREVPATVAPLVVVTVTVAEGASRSLKGFAGLAAKVLWRSVRRGFPFKPMRAVLEWSRGDMDRVTGYTRITSA